MKTKRYCMFWKSHFPRDFSIFGKLGLIERKGFIVKVFDVKIFGFSREPNGASHDACFNPVSHFGDTPLGVEVGTRGKSGLKTRIITSPILPAVGIETR